MYSLAFMGLPGGMEWVLILLIGLLLFGRRLPEVGRSLGQSIVEFKRGVKGVQDEIESASDEPTSTGSKESPGRPAELESEHSSVEAPSERVEAERRVPRET